MAECIFCSILAGEAPASFVYRDEVCSAFVDIQPVNLGHLLVIPNVHATHLADLDGETAAHLMRIGHRLAAALRVGRPAHLRDPDRGRARGRGRDRVVHRRAGVT